jgi:rhamnose transport system substrate-binding protein
MHLNPSSNPLIGNMIIKLAADNLPEGGDVAVLSATATATNQNTWIAEMNKVLPTTPRASTSLPPSMAMTTRRQVLSRSAGADPEVPEPQGHHRTDLRRHRCCCPGRQDAGKVGQINVTGLGLPSEMAGHREGRLVQVLRDLEPDRPRLHRHHDRL